LSLTGPSGIFGVRLPALPKEEIVSSRYTSWARLAWAGVALLIAVPALADVTVQARYRLPDGTTLERANYYTKDRSRVTSFDGREYIYDGKSKQVTVIDHKTKRYWTGAVTLADSIVTRLNSQRDSVFRVEIAKRQEEFDKFIDQFNAGIVVNQTEEQRKIAGYNCSHWIVSAGRNMIHDRWVASGFTIVKPAPELDRVLMAGALDPLGRQLVKMLLGARDIPGLNLSATTTYKTPTQAGTFSWEATKVTTDKISATAWETPKDYQRVEL
jgi:hypothetical protein